jgi:ribonuclease P/MRP protein subunit RPP40
MELNKLHCTAMLLIDLAKVFDKVWYDGLIFKLHELNVPAHIISVLDSYLNHTKYSVYSENCTSQLHSILAGVPQGSSLGLLLFNMYLNNIPTNDKTQLAIYPNDTAVLSSSPLADIAMRRFQSYANDITNYCKNWRLQINASKCELVLCASKSARHRTLLTVTLNGTAVPTVPHAKYLSIYFDKYLTRQQHIKYSTTKAHQRLAMLYSLLQKTSKINQDTVIIIYKACICPLFLHMVALLELMCVRPV